MIIQPWVYKLSPAEFVNMLGVDQLSEVPKDLAVLREYIRRWVFGGSDCFNGEEGHKWREKTTVQLNRVQLMHHNPELLRRFAFWLTCIVDHCVAEDPHGVMVAQNQRSEILLALVEQTKDLLKVPEMARVQQFQAESQQLKKDLSISASKVNNLTEQLVKAQEFQDNLEIKIRNLEQENLKLKESLTALELEHSGKQRVLPKIEIFRGKHE